MRCEFETDASHLRLAGGMGPTSQSRSTTSCRRRRAAARGVQPHTSPSNEPAAGRRHVSLAHLLRLWRWWRLTHRPPICWCRELPGLGRRAAHEKKSGYYRAPPSHPRPAAGDKTTQSPRPQPSRTARCRRIRRHTGGCAAPPRVPLPPRPPTPLPLRPLPAAAGATVALSAAAAASVKSRGGAASRCRGGLDELLLPPSAGAAHAAGRGHGGSGVHGCSGELGRSGGGGAGDGDRASVTSDTGGGARSVRRPRWTSPARANMRSSAAGRNRTHNEMDGEGRVESETFSTPVA